MRGIDTPSRTAALRSRVVDEDSRSILVSRIAGSAQELDLSAPTNCRGLGRVRHFRRHVAEGWPENPLPIVPAARWLGLPDAQAMEAQVFQIAACPWRCWYCFVPFEMLRADPVRSEWVGSDALVDEYLSLPNRPQILDLSGGSPDLAPEWVAWTLDALDHRGAGRSVFVWSDDNLGSDRLVTPEGRALLSAISGRPNYAKVCCLKGFDAGSFAFNTRAAPEGFDRQIAILRAYAASDLNIYVYLPLVGPPAGCARSLVEQIVGTLHDVRPDLPARTVPLLISRFGAMSGRLDAETTRALQLQWDLVEHWKALAPTFRTS